MYILILKETQQIKGYLIGKTKHGQLVFQCPKEYNKRNSILGRFVIELNAANEAKYTIERVV